jgi:hypothetical protein
MPSRRKRREFPRDKNVCGVYTKLRFDPQKTETFAGNFDDTRRTPVLVRFVARFDRTLFGLSI